MICVQRRVFETRMQIMKKTQTSVIISIKRDKSVPLQLQNDDIIYSTDLVRKLGEKNGAYRLLSEFPLEYGEISYEVRDKYTIR